MAKSEATGMQELRQELIGAFLLRRLRELGLKHVIDVAGDFNLEFLEQLEADAGLKWIGCCNELNAAYAHAMGNELLMHSEPG
jgi:TPP-dependent 2-oxoacid decarboxylase